MSDSTRGRRQKRQRDELLDTAAELLLERGLEGFSMRELARRTDYTPGALYNFFPGKDALLEELAGRVFTRFESYLAGVGRDLPTGDRLTQLSNAYLRFASEHSEEYLLLFTRIPAPGTMTFDDPADAPAPWRHLIDACRDGALAGELKARDDRQARIAFFEFFALHHGLAMLRLTRMRALPEPLFEGLSRGVRETFIAGLLGAGPDPRPGSAPAAADTMTEPGTVSSAKRSRKERS